MNVRLNHMKEVKWWKISILVVVCLIMNYAGRMIADYFSLFLWLDSFGTMLSACVLGPVSGAIVGAASNVAFSISGNGDIMLYAITNVMIGLVVGVFAKKGYYTTFFKMSCVASLLAVLSVAISTPLNLIYGGSIGNIWADGVYYYVRTLGVSRISAVIIGQFYVDFIDKLLLSMILYFVLKIRNKIRISKGKRDSVKKGFAVSGVVVFMVGMCGLGIPARNSYGAPEGGTENRDVRDYQEKSQYNSYVQSVFGRENGIPSGEANAIASTNDGVIWIGTYAGLYRYNGTAFRMMKEYDSIKNVNCLYVDDEGRLWVGTNDSGLSICINEQVSNIVDQTYGIPSDSIRSIVEASDGNYYVGTSDSLAVLKLESGLSVVKVIDEIKYAVHVEADQNGHVAAITSDGKLYLLKDGEIRYRSKDSESYYKSARFDEEGNLYVGTSENKVYQYLVKDTELILKQEYHTGRLTEINKIYINDKGELFVCADNGIGYFDLSSLKFKIIETGAYNNSIDDMLTDYQGNLWFASSRMGLLRLSDSSLANIFVQYGIEKSVVNTVNKWQKLIYVGMDNGLCILDEESGKKIENELTTQFQGVRIRHIYIDRQNHMWICSYGKGIVEIKPDGDKVDYYQQGKISTDRVRTGIQISDGSFVTGGEGNILFIKNEEVRETLGAEEGFSGVVPLCFLENRQDVLVGTDGNGIFYIEDGKISKKIGKKDGLSSEVILRMVEDENGIFVVTSNGLNYIDSEGKIRVLHNFPYYNNYDVICAGEQLLVLSSAGIYVMSREDVVNDNVEMNYTLLDTKYGLDGAITANSWNYLDENGNVYLSSENGVYKMNLEDYGKSEISYRLNISRIDFDDATEKIDTGQTIKVERGVSKLTIYPEILNYTRWNPSIEYYMEGVDEEPVVVSQQELDKIVYTDLPFGIHKFHLIVLDRDGKSVLEESIYTVEKTRELYDTTYFKIYMMVVFVLILMWFIWFIIRTQFYRIMEYQKKELELAKKSVEMGNETILAIAKTVDAKDENTAQHSQRVSEYSVMIAKKIGFDDTECENLRKAALLHDIGKIGIPDRVLNKPGRLDDEEYQIMKSHVIRGAEILKDFTLVDNVKDGAMYHHERYDGKGYMRGLSGEDIPLYARIIGIADAFDAMTSNRVYRNQLDLDYVLEELTKGKGTQFDPELCEIMINLIKDGEIDVESLYHKGGDKQ